MKILQTLLFCVSLLIFTGCTSYGKKYSPDKDHEVYYKGDGVDESTAKKLAEYLKSAGYFTDGHQATVQIVKTKDSFNLNFVYDKAQVDADREAKFLIFGGAISRDVFNGAPVNIHLCDNKLEMFKDVGYAKPAE
jgi:hypothetical protein